jgi:hypothetical protein
MASCADEVDGAPVAVAEGSSDRTKDTFRESGVEVARGRSLPIEQAALAGRNRDTTTRG